MSFALVRLHAACNTHNFFRLSQGTRRDSDQSNKAVVPVVSAPQVSETVLFLTYVFDGHSSYSGKSIFAAHANIIKDKGLNLAHFDKVAVLLLDTLLDLGVAMDLVEEVGRKVLALEPLFDPAR
eukprot:gene28167-31267_t